MGLSSRVKWTKRLTYDVKKVNSSQQSLVCLQSGVSAVFTKWGQIVEHAVLRIKQQTGEKLFGAGKVQLSLLFNTTQFHHPHPTPSNTTCSLPIHFLIVLLTTTEFHS